ncbi:MFS transporter [Sphingomonas oryzagri]|uniref:MFS transporter n=1 Tax=Sphingomonas oryzagri TaxID=3042314 RepID=A0ABT6N6Z8_9SPHN|nr:MFS transporter [Sphingomonas oryzagri]MDH7640876.1 MFS transporter [Sphingomonas oryzagri]
MTEKPRQSIGGLWNISFGFFGIQTGFALQNANVTRIFQSLGTSIDNLPLLWIAAPVTGLLVQPLVGHFSDRTWGSLGRRRPYFLAGALLATIALLAMPFAPGLIVAALLLWLLDGSLNVTMEPFRAFVGDMLPNRQRTAGYAMQTAFIGAGAVAASLAPIMLSHVFGVASTAPAGEVPPSVRLAFQIGAAALLVAVLWTIVTTREYSPGEMAAFEGVETVEADAAPIVAPRGGPLWLAAGLAVGTVVETAGLDKPLYILAGVLVAFGIAQIVHRIAVGKGKGDNVLGRILTDLATMPDGMRRLAVVQFCTWSALFILWIYTTPVVAQVAFHSIDPTSQAYADGADWVGVLFAVYNGIAALAAFLLPLLATGIGRKATHMIGLFCGAVGFALLPLIGSPMLLLMPMVLIGIAWSSILTMPYAILSSLLPQRKLGIYMGLFNIFVVLPQLLVSSVMGAVGRLVSPGDPRWTLGVAAVSLVIAGVMTLAVREGEAPPQ